MLYNLFSKFWGRPEGALYSAKPPADLTESIDTNATAPNNPGPGRNVGRPLRRSRCSARAFLRQNSWTWSRRAFSYANLHLPVKLDRNDSIDTNATGPNNPGPGRNVGRLFDAVGTRIEASLEQIDRATQTWTRSSC